MKAKVIATGDIVKVLNKNLTGTHVRCQRLEAPIYNGEVWYKIEEIQYIDNYIDWEQRKFELVKSALQGMLANPITTNIDNKLIDTIVLIADATIEKLKE